MTKMEDFEHIISYLRDYIAICKKKKKKRKVFFVLLDFENIKDTNKLEEQNKQMNSPQCHRGFVGFSGGHCSPLSGNHRARSSSHLSFLYVVVL